MNALTVEDITLRFGGLTALDRVSFEIRRGEIFTMIGPNGAGKTSIFNLISRFYRPRAGCIRFEETNVTDVPPHQVARLGIARTFQNIELFENATVLENMLAGRDRHRTTRAWEEALFLPRLRRAEIDRRRRVEEVIDFLDLQKYRDLHIGSLPYDIRKVGELARALCTEPKLLLLDEPSSCAKFTTSVVL